MTPRMVALVVVCLLAPLRAGAAPGDPDPTFDGNGTVLTDLGGNAAATAVAVQSDGKIVVVGERDDPSQTFAVARFEIDGSPDLSFGTGGLASVDFGNGAAATAVVIDPSGNIIVAGNSSQQVALARFGATGNLDPSFGTAGTTLTDIPAGPTDSASSLVRTASGRLVVGGFSATGGLSQGALVAYDANGVLDSGFGTGGIVITSDPEAITALAATDDGLLATGYSEQRLALARFTLDGAAIGVTHYPEISPGFFGPAGVALDVDADGRAVVVGSTGYCGSALIAQFGADGALDASFGTGGIVTLEVDPGAGCGDSPMGVAFQADGRILFASDGMTYAPSPGFWTYDEWWLARLDPDGAVDTSFGNAGTANLGAGMPAALALQGDGKVLTAGVDETVDLSNLPWVSFHHSLVVRRSEGSPAIACDASPRLTCSAPAGAKRSLLQLVRDTDKPRTQLKWQWKGPIALPALGDPTTGDAYAWCVYDASNALVAAAQVEGGGTCDGRPCWKPAGSSGYQYKNKRGTVWGLEAMKLKAGNGTGQIQLQGKHRNLPRVPLPASLPLRVQVVAAGGACFEAHYGVATKNDATRLTAKSD